MEWWVSVPLFQHFSMFVGDLYCICQSLPGLHPSLASFPEQPDDFELLVY